MTLSEAIEEVTEYRMEQGLPDLDEVDVQRANDHIATAIATILNAVVKGELK